MNTQSGEKRQTWRYTDLFWDGRTDRRVNRQSDRKVGRQASRQTDMVRDGQTDKWVNQQSDRKAGR